MSEEVKRLQPTPQVLRELYLKSGNQCAFPGCTNPIVDESGTYVGQICHIEAAEKGGERFNPDMTNEERRGYDNLMLMCYQHHIITNDVDKYPVSVLKQIKKEHESRFSGVLDEMANSIIDHEHANSFYEAKVCKNLSDVMGYGCNDEENYENTKIINSILNKIKDAPIETRKVLAIMVNRSYVCNIDGCAVPLREIEMATHMTPEYLLRHIDILERRGVLSNPDLDDYGRDICYLYGDRDTGWNYWNDIREYCKRTGIIVENIIVDLNFNLFD